MFVMTDRAMQRPPTLIEERCCLLAGWSERDLIAASPADEDLP